MKFLVPIDLNKNEVRNARIQNLATAPSSPVAGQIYFDTNSDQLNFWDGTQWVNAGGVAQSGIDDLNDVTITSVQDRDFLVYDSGSSAWVNSTVDLGDLADVDTSGAAADKALVYNGTTWVAVNYDLNSLSNVTITGATAADVLYWNGSAWVNQALDTDDVAEGTNLYYTDGRADARIANASIDDLSDVTVTSASSGDFLVWDGSAWVDRTVSIDELDAAEADVSLGGNKITNLGTPTASTDAATKGYVDGVAQGLDVKGSVRAATTGNITLSGTQTVDGVVLSEGDRVLVKNQTPAESDNGIYVVASGVWSRSEDADTGSDLTAGAFVFVEEGNDYADTGWVLSTDDPITVGATAQTWVQFSGAGTYTAGQGLTLSGSEFSVTNLGITKDMIADGAVEEFKLATDAVTTSKIKDLAVTTDKLADDAVTNDKLADDAVKNENIVDGTIPEAKLDTTLTNKINAKTDKVTTNVGDGAATSFAIAHGFGEASVTVYENATNAAVFVDVVNDPSTAGGTVTVSFATAPASNAYRVVVVG